MLNFRCVCLGSLIAVAACDGGDPYATDLLLTTPAAAGGGLVFHDEGADRLVRVRGADAPAIDNFAYEGSPDVRGVTPDGKHLLLLDRTARSLAVADVEAKSTAPFALPAEFSGFLAAADSKALVVFHATGGAGVQSLINTAEVGLIDLSAPAKEGTNPLVATITGLSRAPLRAHISEPIDAADGKHRVVWIDAPSMIGVADFGPAGKVRTKVIQLVAGDSKTLISPAKTVARADGSTLHLYVIATGSNDVLHISINLGTPDLDTVLDQIASGAEPSDIHVVDTAAGLRVLTTNIKSRDLALLDPSTGTGTYVSLESLTDRIVPFTGKDGAPMAMLWRPGVYDFHLVEIDKLKSKKGKAVERVRLDLAITNVLAAGDRFLFQHGSQVDRGLSVYDAAVGKQTVYGGTGGIQTMLRQKDAVFALGLVNGNSRISRIDLNDLHGTSIELKGRKAGLLLPFGDDGVVAGGPGLGGWWLAVFGSGELKADKGNWLEAFALHGVL